MLFYLHRYKIVINKYFNWEQRGISLEFKNFNKMKKIHSFLSALLMLITFSFNTNAQNWGNITAGSLTYTKNNVGIGAAAVPADAWLHIYGLTSTVAGSCITTTGSVPSLVMGYTNPELWLDRAYSFGGFSTCHANYTPNFLQVGYSPGYMSPGILDVINPSGWLGILTVKPTEPLDVNGNGIIRSNLTVNLNETVGGNLTVTKNATIDQNATVDKYLTVGLNATINKNLYVGVDANVSRWLTVGDRVINLNSAIGDNYFRTIQANSSTGGIGILAGNGWGTGSYISIFAENATNPGGIDFVSNYSGASGGNGFSFYNKTATGEPCAMRINNNNKVVIGWDLMNGSISNPTPDGYLLYVETGILTEKLKVANRSDVNWSDFVFNKDYKLTPLNDVETYVKTNKHLPEIPSASEVAKDGIDVASMDAKLLQKIEELTLYVIQQQKEIDELKQQKKH